MRGGGWAGRFGFLASSLALAQGAKLLNVGDPCDSADIFYEICGTQGLACVNDTCGPCVDASSCPDLFVCREDDSFDEPVRLCQRYSMFEHVRSGDVAASVLTFLGAMLAAGGGIGGGGLFVPLFMLLIGLTPHEAMIFGGGIVNYAMNAQCRHPVVESRQLINYEAALMLEPLMLAGTVVGVTANTAFPKWLIVTLLVVVLAYGAVRTGRRGLRTWRRERAAAAARRKHLHALDEGEDDASEYARAEHGVEMTHVEWVAAAADTGDVETYHEADGASAAALAALPAAAGSSARRASGGGAREAGLEEEHADAEVEEEAAEAGEAAEAEGKVEDAAAEEEGAPTASVPTALAGEGGEGETDRSMVAAAPGAAASGGGGDEAGAVTIGSRECGREGVEPPPPLRVPAEDSLPGVPGGGRGGGGGGRERDAEEEDRSAALLTGRRSDAPSHRDVGGDGSDGSDAGDGGDEEEEGEWSVAAGWGSIHGGRDGSRAAAPAQGADAGAPAAKPAAAAAGGDEEAGPVSSAEAARRAEVAALEAQSAGHARPMAWVLAVLTALLVTSLLRGGRAGADSVIGVAPCSAASWLLGALALALMAAFTAAFARAVLRRHARRVACGYRFVEGDVRWTRRNAVLYPALATTAGAAGGLLGIGGGMIMSPLLLELGLLPAAASATSALTVLVSAAAGTLQFVVLDLLLLERAAWYCSLGAAATFLGQTVVNGLVRRYQSSAIIVFTIVLVMAVATVLMGIVGVLDVARDLREGRSLGFRPVC